MSDSLNHLRIERDYADNSQVLALTVRQYLPRDVFREIEPVYCDEDGNPEPTADPHQPPEIVQCGNVKRAAEVAEFIKSRGEYGRLVVGNDAPSGTGVIPLGILRTIAWLSSLGGMEPALAVCAATGNTARLHNLNRGRIAPGLEADLAFMDASMGSSGKDLLACLAEGDTPGVSIVMVDGKVVVSKSRNTPPAVRKAETL